MVIRIRSWSELIVSQDPVLVMINRKISEGEPQGVVMPPLGWQLVGSGAAAQSWPQLLPQLPSWQ